MNVDDIEHEARAILAAEAHRAAVDRAVQRLRMRRSLLDRIRSLIPFTITRKKPYVPH